MDADTDDFYDDTMPEIIGDKRRESAELEALVQDYLARGGTIHYLQPWQTGLVGGFMTKAVADTVNAQNESIKRRYKAHDERLVRTIGDLLARRANTSISTIASNSGSSAAKIRKLILEHYGDNQLALAWLADGRANGNSATARGRQARARV